MVAIAGMSANAVHNTSNVSAERTLEYAADGVLNATVESVRSSYTTAIYSGTPVNCTNTSPGTVNGQKIYVTCTGVSGAGDGQAGLGSRVVDFYACTSTTCSATNSVIHAQVTYEDYLANAALPFSCNPNSNATCGITETIDTWDVLKADN
jgi:hypothetical protein